LLEVAAKEWAPCSSGSVRLGRKLLLNLSKLVNPSNISSIEITVKKRVLDRGHTQNERAHETIHVETRHVEANGSQDHSVRDLWCSCNRGVGGERPEGEADERELVWFANAASVLARTNLLG
jgi:hypothetical protein